MYNLIGLIGPARFFPSRYFSSVPFPGDYLNEPHDQGELKNHYEQNFKCWPAVGMRFQIPQF